MVEFCPECGSILRKKTCRCGYTDREITTDKISLIQMWDPPSPNIIYCKITATRYKKLKLMLNKGVYPEKLKEIKVKIRNRLYSCNNCVYFHEEISHCKIKNKFMKEDSICKTFEPYEKI
jgi:hypothetical protein